MANSAEPDKMQHPIAFHLGLHCLPKNPFRTQRWCVCGGYSDIFIHTYVGSGHFYGVQNFEFQNFLGFQKNEIFWDMKILWIFF